jgi:UTP--glucose-1-phosphate uridylyltransferase
MTEPLVRKCVVPAAGLGTRFLPITKAIPKEMLPIVDKPTLQLIVEEIAASGMEQLILVNGRGKSAIEDHFDISFELETVLAKRGKEADRQLLRNISELVRIVSIRQKEPMGLGHAVLCAKGVVGEEPFGIVLGDDIIDSKKPAMGQLMSVFNEHKKGVIALMKVPDSQTHMYGIAEGEPISPGKIRITRLFEKPKPGTSKSNLAVIGRYLLPPQIFGYIERTKPGVGGEIQLTDALAELAKNEGVIGYEFEGERHDAGDRLGYLKANIAYALKRDDLRPGLIAYMREVSK